MTIRGGAGRDPRDGAPRSPLVLRIEQRLYDAMLEHVRATQPVEACGLIAFDGDRPVELYPGTNVLGSTTRYRMADIEVLRAVDQMDRQGWWLGAIYHSHPSSPPIPSTTDLREANWPDALMLIVSLLDGREDVRAWRVLPAGSEPGYEEVAIEVHPGRVAWLASAQRAVTRMLRGAPGRTLPAREPALPLPATGSAGQPALETAAIPSPAPIVIPEPEPYAERRATIGILGGMGPLATADLYRKIIESTPASRDQEHFPVAIWADPRVPDRTEALLHDGEDPIPWLVHGARQLATIGADFIVIPCNTAHAFLEQVQPAVEKPIVSMIDAAADEVRRFHPQATTVGLLATNGTITTGIYQRALEARGLATIVPDDDTQRANVMAAIRQVKAGQAGEEATRLLSEAARGLVERGAEVLIAACTEIPIALQEQHVSVPLVDATAALARMAIATARHLDEAARAGDPQWETSTSGWGLEASGSG